jgi:hypothetical protein
MKTKFAIVLLAIGLAGFGSVDISSAKTDKSHKTKNHGVVKTLSNTGHDAKDTLSNTGHETKDTLESTGHDAKDTLESTGHDAKNTLEKAGNVPYRALKGFFTGK